METKNKRKVAILMSDKIDFKMEILQETDII